MAREKAISDGEPQEDVIPRPELVPELKPRMSVPDRVAIGSVLAAIAMGFVGGYLIFPAIGFLIAGAILLAIGILVGLS